MKKQRIVVALGRNAFGRTLPEQKVAVRDAASAIADLVEAKYDIIITHSNGPQVGMIHASMYEFSKTHPEYTAAPMSVCDGAIRAADGTGRCLCIAGPRPRRADSCGGSGGIR